MIRLRYWRSPRTGKERVYLRGGLGRTVWCEADGPHDLVGSSRGDLWAAIWPGLVERGLGVDCLPHESRNALPWGWSGAWAQIVRVARREHERRIARLEADLARYARYRACHTRAARLWLRVGRWWRRWVLGRAAG